MGILELPLELNLKEHYSFYMFDELTKEITKDLEAKESRQRARRDDAQAAFEYAVKHILEQLWRNSLSLPPCENTIHLGRSYYSELAIGVWLYTHPTWVLDSPVTLSVALRGVLRVL